MPSSRLLGAAFTCCVVLSTWSAALSSSLCRWSEVHESGELHYTFFLRSESSFRLYHIVWSADRTLLNCVWSDDVTAKQSYALLCMERGEFNGDAYVHAHSLFIAQEGQQCVEAQGSKVRHGARAKRSFIVPGTLWCGSGNKAPSYGDLGAFSATDSCCREHDQCLHTIQSFHSKYGVFNANIFTMSHCDCDNRFHACLKHANDSIADVVGFTFFNVLKLKCFTLSHRLQCSHRNWFGMCKEKEMSLYADVHLPTLYETKNSTLDNAIDSDLQLYAIATAPPLSPRTVNDSDATASNDTFSYDTFSNETSSYTSTYNATPSYATPSNATPSNSMPSYATPSNATRSYATPSNATPSNATPSNATPSNATPSNATSSNATPSNATPTNATPSNATPSTATPSKVMWAGVKNTFRTDQEARVTDDGNMCDVYKDLDQCTDRILPQQRKHGLFNADTRTLFHCTCRDRFFQSVAHQTLTSVHALLMGHVSTSCFLPQDCSENHRCLAVLVNPQISHQQWMNRGLVPDGHQRPPVVRRMRTKNRRNPRVVKLYKLCVRMSRRTHANKYIKRVKHISARLH